jgi:hypothetical protein
MVNNSILKVYASSCLLMVGIIVVSVNCFSTVNCSPVYFFPITSCVTALLLVLLGITFILVNKNFDLILKEKSLDYENKIDFLKDQFENQISVLERQLFEEKERHKIVPVSLKSGEPNVCKGDVCLYELNFIFLF